MFRFLIYLPLLALLVGCGPKAGKALKPDERLNKFESRMNQARKAMKNNEVPDLEDMERLATQYATACKGSPKEADSAKLAELVRELAKKANAKATVETIKKGFGEIEQLFTTLKAPS